MELPVDMRQYHRRESMIQEKSKRLEMRTLPALSVPSVVNMPQDQQPWPVLVQNNTAFD